MPARLPSHATQIGSLVRPATLLTAQTTYNTAPPTSETHATLLAARRAATAQILGQQQSHGVYALTNGEFDREFYFSGFFEELEGFKEVERPVPWSVVRMCAPPMRVLWREEEERRKGGDGEGGEKGGYFMAVQGVGRIRNERLPAVERWQVVRDLAMEMGLVREEVGARCKFTLPPPCFFHLRLAKGKCYDGEVYGSDDEFFKHLAEAYRVELHGLWNEGLRDVQIDDPTLAYFCDEEMIKGLKEEGEDAEALLDTYIKAHNACIAGRPEGMHAGLHVCRGNAAKSQHFSQGSYEAIAEKFFRELDYDTFYLEYDNPRSGDFEPLRFLPRDKNVVLGVITTKDPELEDVDVVKSRVRQAAEIIARGQDRSIEEVMDHIGISPQCGFASVAIGADGMTEERMFAKLKLVQDIAKELWPGRA